jgi:hypothetical protein
VAGFSAVRRRAGVIGSLGHEHRCSVDGKHAPVLFAGGVAMCHGGARSARRELDEAAHRFGGAPRYWLGAPPATLLVSKAYVKTA